jgi:hypothetical protein
MRKLSYLFAATALYSLTLLINPISASPLASGLTDATLPEVYKGRVQKVHNWHCRKRYGWFHGEKGWHRHWRACWYYDPGIATVDDDEDEDGELKSTKHTISTKHANHKKSKKHKKFKKRKKSKKHKNK